MANSTYPCGTCGGGGLVPSANCRCGNGNVHTCSPRTCPRCGGSGWLSSSRKAGK